MADGSLAVLNARSAIDVNISPIITEINLRQGEILFDGPATSKQKTIISNDYGQVISTGGRCNIKLTENGCYVLSLDKDIKILAKNRVTTTLIQGKQFITLKAGEAVTLSDHGASPILSGQAHKAQWSQGFFTSPKMIV